MVGLWPFTASSLASVASDSTPAAHQVENLPVEIRFVALLESGFWTAFVVIILVIVFNTIVDNVISPRVMGQSVGLSSLVVFLSLILWAWVLGGVGALIAVPMTLMVKLLFLDSYESTRPISQFMETGILDEHRKRRRRRKQEKEAAAGVGASGNSD